MSDWTDGYWASPDGLTLHYRDYPGPPGLPPILCIPGLTRNARDFEAVAGRLAGEWRLICVDLRGRGGSDHAEDPSSYVPPVYVADIEALLVALGVGRFVVFGTSLGGLVAMLVAWRGASRIAGALVNDVGPAIEPAGIARILSFVGVARSWPGWTEAAAWFAAAQSEVHPGWTADEWLAHARRLCRQRPDGAVAPDYDMRIAEPIRAAAGEAPVDLWPAWRALDGVPTLLVRGALSDLLGDGTAARMAEEVASLATVTVPGVGHAPTLDEPEARAAIDRLLARVGSEGR
jgi:pimeloyl-ACP methyl ester carboxylesterase